MKDYYKLLRDPRWFRKRKMILKRDNNKCTVCESNKKLIVHHTFYYDKDTRPWLYPNNSLITLCKECHENWHKSNEHVILKKPEPKIYVPTPRRELAKLNYYEIEYIGKKGGWGVRYCYAKSDADALYNLRAKIKEVIKIKKHKNPCK